MPDFIISLSCGLRMRFVSPSANMVLVSTQATIVVAFFGGLFETIGSPIFSPGSLHTSFLNALRSIANLWP